MQTERQMPCIRYDRIVGYFAPFDLTANKGKKEEISERKRYDANNKKAKFKDTVLDYVNE